MTAGLDDCSPPATPSQRRATYAEPPTGGWKLNTATKRQRSRPPVNRTGGTRATHATSNGGELAALLLEGWERGWLRLSPPRCCA